MKIVAPILSLISAAAMLSGCDGKPTQRTMTTPDLDKPERSSMPAPGVASAQSLSEARAANEAAAQDQLRQRQGSEVLDAKTMADMNLKAQLRDADSAKFKDVFVSRLQGGNLMVCGKVNAKNVFGAYTGFERFIASPNPNAPSIIDGEGSGLSRDQFQQAYAAACSEVVERF